MIDPIDAVLHELMQKTDMIARRAMLDDRPDLIANAYEYATLTERLANAFNLPSPLDPESYIADVKKRFLLTTTFPVVPGIFSHDAIAVPIDPTPLRQNGRSRLGVGLAEHRQQRVAIDAPWYRPDHRCYGFIIPNEPLDGWYTVREQGDVSYVMTLAHEWVSTYGVPMVVVEDVIGIGRYALDMSDDSIPGLTDRISHVRDRFDEQFVTLPPGASEIGIRGFYHLGRECFYSTPWDAIKDNKRFAEK